MQGPKEGCSTEVLTDEQVSELREIEKNQTSGQAILIEV